MVQWADETGALSALPNYVVTIIRSTSITDLIRTINGICMYVCMYVKSYISTNPSTNQTETEIRHPAYQAPKSPNAAEPPIPRVASVAANDAYQGRFVVTCTRARRRSRSRSRS